MSLRGWEGGELLFPSFPRSNINRLPKTTLTKIGLPEGEKYTPNAFRRDSAHELLQTGNTLEVTKGPGGWWGSGVRSYVDLEMDNAFRISMALIVLSDGSSSEDEQKTKHARQRRTPWRKAQLPNDDTSVSTQIHRHPQGPLKFRWVLYISGVQWIPSSIIGGRFQKVSP